MNRNGDAKSLFRMGVIAASLAVVALLIGGVALAISGGATAANGDELLTIIGQNTLTFTVGYVAIALISLLDIFTVPGLYTALWKDSNILTAVAVITAIVGDLLGVTGGLIQMALLSLSARLAGASSAALSVPLAGAETLVVLEGIFSSAGFLLVGVSFVCFGLAILRGTFGKWIGWVAVAAGAFSILGQVPPLATLFMLANVTYLLWYIGIAMRFNRLATGAEQDR